MEILGSKLTHCDLCITLVEAAEHSITDFSSEKLHTEISK